MPVKQYLDVALILLVSIAAVNDLATRRIPNRLLLTGLICALFLHAYSADPVSSLLSAVGGMGVGFVAFLPFYLLHGMAAGDVKMIATVGAFIGPAEAFHVAMLSWCVGGVMALLLVAFRGRLNLLLGNVGRMLYGALIPGVGIATPGQTSVGSMPYGVAIAIGTVTVLVRDYS